MLALSFRTNLVSLSYHRITAVKFMLYRHGTKLVTVEKQFIYKTRFGAKQISTKVITQNSF